ncbi:ankyrin repeat-containing domain protein [Ilyonectria destructans]|nr:ankyrin repeat-containing domain protein [Ilyonectria destructans]
MSINWKLYEQDINRWYLDQDKTVKETVQLLKDAHHVVVTERQFKSKFGGLKNLRANEWKAVIPHIRRREAQGIASVVYLCGKRLKLDSTTTAVRRYSKSPEREITNEREIDLGIDTIGLHRIEIRTPVMYSAASALIRHPNTSQASVGSAEVQQTSDDVVRKDLSRQIVLSGLVTDLDDIEIDFSTQMDVNFSVENILKLPNLFASPQLSGSTIAGQNRPNSFSQFLDLESWSRNGPKRPFQSFWDLPEIPSMTSLVSSTQENNSLRTVLDNYSEAQRLQRSVPRGPSGLPYCIRERQNGWVLSKLVDANSRLATLETMAELVDDLIQSQTRTTRQMALSDDAAISAASVHLHEKLLPVVAFIISNNHYDDHEIMSFLTWVIQNGLMTQLSRLLETAPTDALAFRSALLKAICTFRSPLWGSKRIVRSSEFLSLVSSNRHYLQGPLGTRLLFLSIEEGCLELTRLLVSHGVDINQLFLYRHTHTTLVAFAARMGNEPTINYLISAGADINKRCSIEGCCRNDTTALVEAVESEHFHIVKLLVEKGARFNDDETVGNGNIFQLAWNTSRAIYLMLRERVPLINEPDVFELIDAAEMGNQELSSLLLKHGIVHTEILERALHGAIEAGKVNAVGTLLRRGVDPNARLAQLGDSTTESSCDETEFLSPIQLLSYKYENPETVPDLLYLLIKAGAELDKKTAQKLCLELLNCSLDDSIAGLRPLSVLLQSDCNAAWVRPTLLVCWAGMGHISSCGELLDTGTAINDYGLRGESALQMASRCGHVALVHYLLSRGADVKLAPSDSERGASALYAALEGGHHKLAYDLVDAGANVIAGIGQANGATILEAMMSQANRDLTDCVIPSAENYNRTFKKLLALGAPVNRTNGTASRILHNLVETKQHECLELALRAGARTEDTLKGLTPLQAAAFLGDMNSLQILIAHGANVNASEDQESRQLGSQKYSIVTFPKEPDQGGSLNRYIFHRQKYDGDLCCTPLQAASIPKHTNPLLIKFLLEHGANINAPAIAVFGRTALQAATSSAKPNSEVIHLLLLEGADVNAPPAKIGGITALQGAAIQGHIEIARLLLAHGALINALPALDEGRTAVEGAAEHGRMEMVRFLFSEGALPDPFLGFSRAIELAEKECHLGIVKFLREHDPCNLLVTDSLSQL